MFYSVTYRILIHLCSVRLVCARFKVVRTKSAIKSYQLFFSLIVNIEMKYQYALVYIILYCAYILYYILCAHYQNIISDQISIIYQLNILLCVLKHFHLLVLFHSSHQQILINIIFRTHINLI